MASHIFNVWVDLKVRETREDVIIFFAVPKCNFRAFRPSGPIRLRRPNWDIDAGRKRESEKKSFSVGFLSLFSHKRMESMEHAFLWRGIRVRFPVGGRGLSWSPNFVAALGSGISDASCLHRSGNYTLLSAGSSGRFESTFSFFMKGFFSELLVITVKVKYESVPFAQMVPVSLFGPEGKMLTETTKSLWLNKHTRTYSGKFLRKFWKYSLITYSARGKSSRKTKVLSRYLKSHVTGVVFNVIQNLWKLARKIYPFEAAVPGQVFI